MGEQRISSKIDEADLRAFTRSVLNDLLALEKLLDEGKVEEHARRIGAEQEMFLVDSAMRPAPLALKVLEAANEKRLTTEIGLFNLEANLTPLEFSGGCLSQLEKEIVDLVAFVRTKAKKFGGEVILAGILPTIQNADLTYENLTPMPRYYELDRVLTMLSGGTRHIQIKGLDELLVTQHNALIETCNTSFQVHLQVGASEFVEHYNWSQAIAAPVLATAVNSPLLLAHRLWHETRIALFQHATDTRSETHQARNQPTRVSFGDRWVNDSILEVFREDVARFRIILTRDVEEDSLDALAQNKIPRLRAWRLHNGTVWRWNRACYGIMKDKPGLRIEARFLPSGPSIADEMSCAAFFLGLMIALPREFGDVTKYFAFDDAKNNFFNAARQGLNTQLTWMNSKSYPASKLILEELLPRAREGLKFQKIAEEDIERYLGILETRVKSNKTGAQWMIDSLAGMDKAAKSNVRLRTLTAAMNEHQKKNEPVSEWKPATIGKSADWIDNYRFVEQFMTSDLFTVRPEDVLDLAASLMHWKHIRHVPVEDNEGRLVGVVSHRDLLELFASGTFDAKNEVVVRDIMKTDLITISPNTPALDALRLMRERDIGCLPVITDGKLVGLLTAHDFLTVSTRLFEERLTELK